MSALHQDSGGIGKFIPSALEISFDPRDFPGASPSGNLSGVGDGFPNTSRVLVEHGYIALEFDCSGRLFHLHAHCIVLVNFHVFNTEIQIHIHTMPGDG